MSLKSTFKTKNPKDRKRVAPLRKYWSGVVEVANRKDNIVVFTVAFTLGACFILSLWNISSL